MRCKNCGSENDDNLYICQNCGSPLYDEDEPLNGGEEATQVFSAVSGEQSQPLRSNEERLQKEREEKKKKQSIAIIVALAVILIAIIAGIVAFALSNKNKAPDTTAPAVSTTETVEHTTAESTTTTTTTETTTESTTETTTTTTTTTTEAPVTYTLTTSSNDGGETEGDGDYELGENATVIARPDDGYSFDGWYDGSKKVSSSTAYTFTVTKDVTLKAVFTLVNEEPEGDGVDTIEDDD